MKRFIVGFVLGIFVGSAVMAIAAGMTKVENESVEASSYVLYGTPDGGDTVVRVKTDSNGVLQVKGV